MNSIQPQPNSPPDLSSLLTPLSDGRPGIRTALAVQASPAPESKDAASTAVIDFVASNEALDRYNEIIMPAGWRLENYRRNPVFQNAHQYGDVLFTLGKALVTEVRQVAGRPVLFQRIEFAVEINPVARIAYGLYRGKFLNAVSVGFIPVRWENGTAEAGYRRRYVEQELLEVSAVGIPANPEALQLGLQAGVVEKTDLKALLELLHGVSEIGPRGDSVSTSPRALEFCSDPAAGGTYSSAQGVPGHGAQWLQLARALRDILRRS